MEFILSARPLETTGKNQSKMKQKRNVNRSVKKKAGLLLAAAVCLASPRMHQEVREEGCRDLPFPQTRLGRSLGTMVDKVLLDTNKEAGIRKTSCIPSPQQEHLGNCCFRVSAQPEQLIPPVLISNRPF